MGLRTKAVLDRLGNIDWFSNIGVNDTEEADILNNWQDAIDSCASIEWENLCLEAANRLRISIRARSASELQKWNDIVIAIRPDVLALISEKTSLFVKENDLPKVFVDTVEWDVLHYCMEEEYATVIPPDFYAKQINWYMRGHFPCGWRGQFPAGRILIF